MTEEGKSGYCGLSAAPRGLEDKSKKPVTAVVMNKPGNYEVVCTLYAYEGKTKTGKEPVYRFNKIRIPVEFKEGEMTLGSQQQARKSNAVNRKKIKKKSINPNDIDRDGGWER